ncbi:MAG: FAD-dependent oxidoreductase, partial [Candidatus Spyradocola sp.]
MQTIWIDALEFDHYGGFIMDTQFVAEMGQGYLMADGTGTPVAPATVKFTVAEDGYYRFFLRTKNWCMGYDPDGLRLAVDGRLSPHVSGVMQVQHWYFEAAADFALTAGEHVLSVSDTTGWCGRFADVVITNDYDFTPSPELRRMKAQRAQIKGVSTEPIVHDGCDLVVAGSGAAAVVAAIAAARYGLKVALLSARPVLGGTGSDESGVSLDGAACQGFHETGIIYEIKCHTLASHASWSQAYQHFVEREENIELFPNMCVTDADAQNGRIRAALAQDTLNMTEHIFPAAYFIDATGDGWLGYYAGAKYRIGREARFQHNESFAPENADGYTMSGCSTRTIEAPEDTICCYYATEETQEVPFTAPQWAFRLPEGDALGREPERFEHGMWWMENRNDYDDLWEAETARDALIRIAVGYFDWMKNSWAGRDRVKNYRLAFVSNYLAKRETRRLIGDYMMTQNDFAGGARFADEVCCSGWNLDVHHVMGIFSGRDGKFTSNQSVPPTPIPFRCLYSA